MDYYIDINILPDQEFRATVLLNALYAKFHKALCDLHSTAIGVSFPKYEKTLGDILRIHGNEGLLSDLQKLNWVGGMSGYCNVTTSMPVPESSKFRIISRKQITMSQARLRRLLKRGSPSEEDIDQYMAKMFSQRLTNPYIELVSGSNGQKHRRYIEFGELLDKPVIGVFDQFGLSKAATIPWF